MCGMTKKRAAIRKYAVGGSSGTAGKPLFINKILTRLTRAPSTEFERILVHLDEMNKIRGQRDLTKEESRIYNKTLAYVESQFKTMINQFNKKLSGGQGTQEEEEENNINLITLIMNKLETLFKELMKRFQVMADDKKMAFLTALQPSQLLPIVNDTLKGVECTVKEDPAIPPAVPPAIPPALPLPAAIPSAAVPQALPLPATVPPALPLPAAVPSAAVPQALPLPAAVPPALPLPAEVPPPPPPLLPAGPPTVAQEVTNATNVAQTQANVAANNAQTQVDAAANAAQRQAAQANAAANAAVNAAATNAQDTLKAKTDAAANKFTNAGQTQASVAANNAANKFKSLIKGGGGLNVVESLNEFGEKFKDALANIQSVMVNGVGNTATASMDAFLNALCMVPGIGTPMLVWRIFQDLLVVVGASMSVQANSISAARDVVDVANKAKRQSETMSEDLKDAINEKKEEAANAAAKAAEEAAANVTQSVQSSTQALTQQQQQQQGGKGKTAKRRNNIAAYARVIHRSLKRFDGMARARLSHNPKPDHKTALNYAAMPYALKLSSSTSTATATAATNAALKPGLKPVAAN